MTFEVTTWFWIFNIIPDLKSPTFGYVAFLLLIYFHKIYYFYLNLVKNIVWNMFVRNTVDISHTLQ